METIAYIVAAVMVAAIVWKITRKGPDTTPGAKSPSRPHLPVDDFANRE